MPTFTGGQLVAKMLKQVIDKRAHLGLHESVRHVGRIQRHVGQCYRFGQYLFEASAFDVGPQHIAGRHHDAGAA